MPRTISEIIVHHSISPQNQTLKASLTSFNYSHKLRLHPTPNKLGFHIAYHYVIGGKGDWKQTRPDDEIGFHASNLAVNKRSIGICLVGNFDKQTPYPSQLWALRDIIKAIKGRYFIKEVNGHRKYAKKSCPGNKMTDKMIQEAFKPTKP